MLQTLLAIPMKSVSDDDHVWLKHQVSEEGQVGLPNGREEGKGRSSQQERESGQLKSPGESLEGGQMSGEECVQKIEVCQQEGSEERVKGLYGAGSEFDAYVSRGILACPLVGDREVLDSSRHRMTKVFHREAQAMNHWLQEILLWVELEYRWNTGGPGMIILLGSQQAERKEQPQITNFVCLSLRSQGYPQAFCLSGSGKPGVPQLSIGSCCNARWEKKLLSAPKRTAT